MAPPCSAAPSNPLHFEGRHLDSVPTPDNGNSIHPSWPEGRLCPIPRGSYTWCYLRISMLLLGLEARERSPTESLVGWFCAVRDLSKVRGPELIRPGPCISALCPPQDRCG